MTFLLIDFIFQNPDRPSTLRAESIFLSIYVTED